MMKMKMKTMRDLRVTKTPPVFVIVWLSILTAVVAIMAGVYLWRFVTRPRHLIQGSELTCSAKSCGAIDPVNDPDYNMREVIKNTLLIEQHLSESPKFCKQCIVKHFLISIGLLEEASWMAGSSRDTYPMLEDSVVFYKKTFATWYATIDDVGERFTLLDDIRNWRRKASDLYYPTGGAAP